MRRKLKKAGAVVLGVVLFLAASFEPSLAQGFGGLQQFLGGSGGSGGLQQFLGGGGDSRHHQQYSGQSDNAVTVERNIEPFIGKFSGKQKAPSYEGDLNANFACYPALDAALPNSRTFVCYTAEEQPRVPE